MRTDLHPIERAILITTNSDQQFIEKKCRHIEVSLGFEKGFVEVLTNARDQENPVRGCFEAHFNAYQQFLDGTTSNCLILEDDVYFISPLQIDPLKELMTNTQWEMIYLGHRPVINQKTYFKHSNFKGFARVKTNDRHALLMSRQYAEKIIGLQFWGKNGDVLLRNASSECYASYPMIAIQLGKPFSKSFNNGLDEMLNQYLAHAKSKSILHLLFAFLFTPIYIFGVLIKHSQYAQSHLGN